MPISEIMIHLVLSRIFHSKGLQIHCECSAYNKFHQITFTWDAIGTRSFNHVRAVEHGGGHVRAAEHGGGHVRVTGHDGGHTKPVWRTRQGSMSLTPA